MGVAFLNHLHAKTDTIVQQSENVTQMKLNYITMQ